MSLLENLTDAWNEAVASGAIATGAPAALVQSPWHLTNLRPANAGTLVLISYGDGRTPLCEAAAEEWQAAIDAMPENLHLVRPTPWEMPGEDVIAAINASPRHTYEGDGKINDRTHIRIHIRIHPDSGNVMLQEPNGVIYTNVRTVKALLEAAGFTVELDHGATYTGNMFDRPIQRVLDIDVQRLRRLFIEQHKVTEERAAQIVGEFAERGFIS